MHDIALNMFDYFVLAFIFFITLYGLLKGFIGTLLTILVWFGTYYITFFLFKDVNEILQPYFDKEMVLNIVTSTIIFLPTFIILTIFSRAIIKSIHDMRLGIIDRSLGAAIGLFTSGALCILIFIIIILIHNIMFPTQISGEEEDNNIPKFIAESVSFPYLKLGSNFLMTNFSPEWLIKTSESIKSKRDNIVYDDDLNDYLKNITDPESEDSPNNEIKSEKKSNSEKKNHSELEQALVNMPDSSLVELYIRLSNKSKNKIPANRDDIIKEIINILNSQK